MALLEPKRNEDNATLIQEFNEWVEQADILKKSKAKEAELRRSICAELVAGVDMTAKGTAIATETLDGRIAKAKQTLSYKLDLKELAEVWDELTTTEKAAMKLVPTLIMKNYHELPEDSVLRDVVVVSFAMPTLEYKTIGD